MAEKLIKKLNNREFYAKYSDYAAMDEDGERLSDRKVKSVELDAASGTMTVTNTDGTQEIPVVPVPDQEGKVLKSNADGTYSWGAAGAEPGSGKLYVKFGSAPEVDTNFNANSDSKVTLVIPLASAVEGNEEDGLMSSEDKGVLDGLPDKIGRLDDRIIAIEHDYVTYQGLQTALSPIQGDVESLGGQVESLGQGKADKVSPATSGNLASLDAGGDLADSGISGTAVNAALGKLGGIESGAEVNTVVTVKVNGSALTPDEDRAVDIDISGKVDKVYGKQLSTEDYTTEEKTKLAQVDMDSKQDVLDGLPTMAANKYLQTDANQNIVWGNLPASEKNYSNVWGESGGIYGMFNVEVGRDQYGYNAAPRYLTQNGRNGYLAYLLPQPVEGTIPFSIKDSGNNKAYALMTPAQIGLLSAATPTSSDANKVLIVDQNGTPRWNLLNSMTGSTASAAGTSGLVPAPDAGDQDKYLKGDGTWANVPVAVASTSGAGGTDGLMPATDKEKLDGAKSFSTVKVTDSGVTATLPANSLNEDIELVAGDNVTLEAGLVIGGRQYKTVKIGNQVWMAENLDFLPDGIELHEDSPADADFATAGAWYYGNDKVTAQSRGYGLLYNTKAVDYLEANKATLFPGWHVPTESDMNALVGNGSSARRNTMRMPVDWAGSSWDNGAANNSAGFSAIPCGEIHTGSGSNPPRFLHNGSGMEFWSATVNSADNRYFVPIGGAWTFYVSTKSNIDGNALSIRLVKDDSTLPNKVRISSDAALEKSIYGTYIAGEQGEGIEGESGVLSLGENSVELYDTFKGVKFGAERAVADRDGNIIDETYAKKSEVPDVSQFQQKLVPDTKTAAATVTVENNKVTLIELASDHSISAMEISCAVVAGESANFAVEIDNKSASLDCVVTLVLTVGGVQQTIRLATSSGAVAKAKAGKYYQLTCVGSCWTLAEFA